MADIIQAIEGLTDRVVVCRLWIEIARVTDMPMVEIKGLKADIASIKAGIAGVRSAAQEVRDQGAGLQMELADLRDQLKVHRDDLRFEAETLGNSGPEQAGQKPPDQTGETFSKPGAGGSAN